MLSEATIVDVYCSTLLTTVVLELVSMVEELSVVDTDDAVPVSELMLLLDVDVE